MVRSLSAFIITSLMFSSLVLLAVTFTALAAETLSDSYNSLVRRMQSGDVEGACREAEVLASQHPDFHAVHSLLGLCATQAGELAKAETLFRRSLELNPRFVEARLNLAVNLLQQGKNDEGKAHLQALVQLAPGNVTALFNLGRIELEAGHFAGAVKYLRRAHELVPNERQIRLLLATALVGSGELKSALNLSRDLIRKVTDDAGLLISAALLALESGDEEVACEGLHKAVEVDPTISERLFQMARTAYSQGQFKSASTFLKTIEAEYADSAEWNAMLGYAAYKLEHPEQALARLRRAIELDPNVEDYYLNISELMLFYNSDKAAVAFLKAGLERLPSSAPLHSALGVAYLSRGLDPNASIAHLDTALSLRPDYEPALSFLCLALSKTKKWNRLLEVSEKLIRLTPESHEGHYYKASAMIESRGPGDDRAVLEEAREILEESIRLNPRFAAAYVAFGKLLTQKGQLDEAIRKFEQAVEVSSENSGARYHLARAYLSAGEREKGMQEMAEYERLHTEEERRAIRTLFQVEQ